MFVLTPTTEYKKPICLALGFFDCVHLGHAALLDRAKERAKACGALSCAVTFSDNPYPLLGRNVPQIFTFSERVHLLQEAGVDCVLALPFTEESMRTDKNDFLRSLFSRFTVRGFVCGHDYRFGANAQGTPQDLIDFCKKTDSMCDVIPPVLQDGARISSTRVRQCLQTGDLAGAQRLMGHAYFAEGNVCHGRGVGRLFDFPTANLVCPEDKLLPMRGVYATKTTVRGNVYRSVTNVGDKPTFSEASDSVETLLSDFTGDLYDTTIRVEFVRRLRDIRKFASPYELRAQILADAQWREEQ